MVSRPRRRTVVLGGLTAVGAGLLAAEFAREGTSSSQPSIVTGTFESAAMRGATVPWVVVYPPTVRTVQPVLPLGGRVPVVICLHGKGGTQKIVQDLGLDLALATAVNAGMAPFALVSVAGGDGYWHARKDGTDSGAMVTDELLPLLSAQGLAVGPAYRVALMGWSMGGFGAIRLAELLGPSKVRAVVATSPALWLHPGDSAPGAFDDAQDFRRVDVFARRSSLRGIRMRVDCGLSDPFLTATRSFVSGLDPAPAGGFGPGGHDDAYWRSVAPAQLAFLGAALDGTSVNLAATSS